MIAGAYRRLPIPSKMVVMAAAIALALAGAAMLAGSLVASPQRLASKLGEDGDPLVARERAVRLVGRARTMGLAYLLAGNAVAVWRRRVTDWLDRIRLSVARTAARARREAKSFLRSRDALFIAALAAVGAILRWQYLHNPIRFDEAVSYLFFIARGPVTILATYGTNNHVLQNLFAWITTKALGPTPAAMRASTFLAGTFLIPLAYFAARAVWGRAAGLLAAALVATMPYFVFLSVNARGYAILLCCFAICLALCPALRRTNSWALWLAFAIAAAIGMFAIPVMIYPLLMLSVWLAALSLERSPVPARQFLVRAAAAAVVCAALFVLLYTPVMIKSGFTVMLVNKMAEGMPREQWAQGAGAWVRRFWTHWAKPLRLAFAALAGALILLEMMLRRGRRTWVSPVLALIMIFPALVFYQSVYTPPRVAVFAGLLLLMSASAGAAALGALLVRRPWGQCAVVATFAIAALCVFGGATALRDAGDFAETGRCRDAPQMAELLKNTSPSDRIAFSYLSRRPIEYYFAIKGAPPIRPRSGTTNAGATWLVADESVDLENALSQANLADRLPAEFHEHQRFAHGGRIYCDRPAP